MSKLYRLGVGAVVAVMSAAGLGGAISARAQDITEFRNGYITFTNENPSLYYRIEFKPNLTDPVDWDGLFKGLRNIHSLDAEVTVPVGVFYRVVGRETPWVAGTALASDLLSGKTAYVDDEEITGTMANIGAQNVTPGIAPITITAGYHSGEGSVAGDTDLATGNIRAGVTIFGVEGDPNVVNTADANAVAGDMLADKTAYVGGSKVTGTIATQTLSADNETVAAGYYAGTTAT